MSEQATADTPYFDPGDKIGKGDTAIILDTEEKLEFANAVAVEVATATLQGYRTYLDGIFTMLGRYYSDDDLGALLGEGFDALMSAATKEDPATGKMVWIDDEVTGPFPA